MLAGIVILLSKKNSLAILYLRISHCRLYSGIDAGAHRAIDWQYSSGIVKERRGIASWGGKQKGSADTRSLSIHKL